MRRRSRWYPQSLLTQKAACNVLSVEFFDDEMKIDDLNDLTTQARKKCKEN
jgi:hypothetical protein